MPRVERLKQRGVGGKESENIAKCGKHEDAGYEAMGDQERDGLTWLCQTSVITKHPKLHTLI